MDEDHRVLQPQTRMAYIYATQANESEAETFLVSNGIAANQRKEQSSLQTTITEYIFSCDDTLYSRMAGEIISASSPFMLTRQRLGIGPSSVTAVDAPHETILEGSKTAGAAAAQLIVTSTSCKRVTIIADPDNTDRVLIGNATSQTNKLVPGDNITLFINDLSKIYVKRAGSVDQTVTYIGTV